MAKNSLILEVKFQKIGNRIKYTLPVAMYCERMKKDIPNTGTFDKTDGLFVIWLGKDIDSLFKKTDTIFKKVNINQVYDYCDKPKSIR